MESAIKINGDDFYISGWKVWAIILLDGLPLGQLTDKLPFLVWGLINLQLSPTLNSAGSTERKRESLTKPIIQNFTRGKKEKQVQDKAKNSGNIVDKSFIYK